MTDAWPNNWPTLSAPAPAPQLRVLSLGAGVQSTTLALAAARGEVGPMPDCAIFADTQWEPRAVREHLDWLEGRLPFPLYRVSIGSIRDHIIERGSTSHGRFDSVPWFIRQADGKIGLGKRECTSGYKLNPIRREIRRLLGVGPRARIAADAVEIWVGISMDEVVRMKPSRVRYMRNRWPLIEAGMDRQACHRWLAERQFSAPRSACIGCPFRKNSEWRHLRDTAPDEWADAIYVDRALRSGADRGLRGVEYMHRSCVPLEVADLNEPDANQLGFDLECEGMCGS